jgi:DNA-directed RNA polymerase subunit RPC12/RpoP
MIIHECSECGAEMEFLEAEPDVGIMASAWICLRCEHTELAEVEDDVWF